MESKNITLENRISKEETLYTTQQVADILGIKYDGAYAKLVRNGISPYRVKGKSYFYTAAQLEKLKVKKVTTIKVETVYYIYQSKMNY